MKHLLTFIVVLLSFCGPLSAQKKYMFRTDDGVSEYFYFPATIQNGHSASGKCNYTQVWVVEQAAEGQQDMFRRHEIGRQREASGQTMVGYDNFAEHKELFQIDCARRMYRTVAMTNLNEDGSVLLTMQRGDNEAEWKYLDPESVVERIVSIICDRNKSNKNSKKK